VAGRSLDHLEHRAQTPLEQAQSLIWDAFEEPNKRKRLSMAEKALEISPDCADAYVLLSEDKARNPKERIVLLRKGVTAGKRAIADLLDSPSPEMPFWVELRTRPYMRALDGLALALFCDDQNDEALELWKELLRLDAQDHLGARLNLVPLLVECGHLDEAQVIIDLYADDSSPQIMFSHALIKFQKLGNCPQSIDVLEDAIVHNPHMLRYLLEFEDITPADLRQAYSDSSEEDAVHYSFLNGDVWDQTGALDWMFDYLQSKLRKFNVEKTFPGILEAAPKNVIDLGSFRKR